MNKVNLSRFISEIFTINLLSKCKNATIVVGPLLAQILKLSEQLKAAAPSTKATASSFIQL